jgi:tetratricopeptide (TPR) repeat protein
VVVEGETGIGKTRLVEEFLRSPGSSGNAVVVLTLLSGSRETAGGLAGTLLGGLSTAPGLGAASPAALATAVALVPAIGARFPTLLSSEGRLPVEDAVAEALTAVAEDRPVIVFVDDVERFDDSDFRLLATAARKVRGRVLILACLGTDQHLTSAALAELTGSPRVRRLKLPPLSLGEVEALLASMLVLPAAERHSLAARLHAEGGGNPLYTIELAAALVDEGVLAVGDQGAWRLVHPDGWRTPLPTGLRAIIASRLARLSDDARTVAEAMGGLAPDAPEHQARAVANLPSDRFDLGRDELIARRLIHLAPDLSGRSRFSHELVRRIVVDGGPDTGHKRSPAPRPSAAAPGRAHRRMLVAGGLALVVAGSGFAAARSLGRPSRAPGLEGRDLVVARPELAADATQPESLAAYALRLGIDRTVPYRLLPAPALRSVLARMRRDTTGADEATAREVAIRAGSGLVILPSVARVSDHLTVAYRLADAETGRTLKLRQVEGSRPWEPRKLTVRLLASLEDDLAEAARRVPARATLPPVTTASLEALRAYHLALQLLAKSDEDWVPQMHRAIELDSAFAAPYGMLAYEYWFAYDQRSAAVYADAGERLARGLPTAERLQVLLDVANAREDWPTAITCARTLLGQDRSDPSKWLTLAQLYYFDGQYSRAVEAYDSAVAKSAPARPPTVLMNQATVLGRVGREREAAALYEEGFAAESSLVRHPFVSHEYGVTLVRLGRTADARAAYRRRLDDIPSGRAGGLRSLAMLEAHLGHFALATELLADAGAASSGSGDTLGTAIANLLQAEIQLTRGNRTEALADLAAIEQAAARRLLPYEVLGRSVKLLARLGATSRAEALLRRVESQTTAVSGGARARLLLARGEVLLARGRPAEGRTAVEQALALWPSDDALESAGFAALAAHAPEAAAARYDSLTAQHAMDWDGHAVIELGRYWAARARETAGQQRRALSEYQDFLAGWPEADPDLPAVAEARRRIAAR